MFLMLKPCIDFSCLGDIENISHPLVLKTVGIIREHEMDRLRACNVASLLKIIFWKKKLPID